MIVDVVCIVLLRGASGLCVIGGEYMYYVILTLLAVGIPMFFLIRYFNKKYEREKYLYTEEERERMEEAASYFTNEASLGGIEDEFLGYTRTPSERLGERL